jgi:hypothetical protein
MARWRVRGMGLGARGGGKNNRKSRTQRQNERENNMRYALAASWLLDSNGGYGSAVNWIYDLVDPGPSRAHISPRVGKYQATQRVLGSLRWSMEF